MVGQAYVIANRVRDGLPPRTKEEIDKQGLALAGIIPEDPLIAEFDSQGKPTLELPNDSIALQAAYSIFQKLFR